MKSFKFSIELFTFFSSSKNSWSFPNSSVILIMNSLKSNDFSSISCTSLSVDTTIWSYLGFQSWFYKNIYMKALFDFVVGWGVAVELHLHLGELVRKLLVETFEEFVGCLFLQLHMFSIYYCITFLCSIFFR